MKQGSGTKVVQMKQQEGGIRGKWMKRQEGGTEGERTKQQEGEWMRLNAFERIGIVEGRGRRVRGKVKL